MLKSLEEKLGLPPLKQSLDLVTGPTGKRLEKLLDRLEALSRDGSTLPQVIRLLEIIKDLDSRGTLARLDDVLKGLPKGKQGEALVAQLATLLKELGPRLDKLTHLADALLKDA